MTKRTLLAALTLALLLPLFTVVAHASYIRVEDIWAARYSYVDLYDAVIDYENGAYVTFYRDYGGTDPISDPTRVRVSSNTRFYARASYRGEYSHMAPFYVHVDDYDQGDMTLSAVTTAGSLRVRLTATVKRFSNTPSPSGYVTFYEDGDEIGTAQLSGGKATYTWYAPDVDVYWITAYYDGDSNYGSADAERRVSLYVSSGTDANTPTDRNTSAPTAAKTFGTAEMSSAATGAVSLARSTGASIALVTLEGPGTVSRAGIDELIRVAGAESLTVRAHFDAKSAAGNVTSRIYADFAPGQVYQGSGFDFGAETVSAAVSSVKSTFDRYFANKVAIARLGEQDGFGMTVDIAVYMNLDSIGAANRYFYIYRAEDNQYVPVSGYVDSAGYVHVQTDRGGYIVVSDGALQLR